MPNSTPPSIPIQTAFREDEARRATPVSYRPGRPRGPGLLLGFYFRSESRSRCPIRFELYPPAMSLAQVPTPDLDSLAEEVHHHHAQAHRRPHDHPRQWDRER